MSTVNANMIAESMYDMCDKDRNRVVLFDMMVAHKRCLTANTHSHQKFTDNNGKVQYTRSMKGC